MALSFLRFFCSNFVKIVETLKVGLGDFCPYSGYWDKDNLNSN
jgi:hypothetical protein